METKLCKKCLLEFPLEKFHKNKCTKDGHHALCPNCKKEYDKFYRQRKEYKDKENLRGSERRAYDWRYRFMMTRVNAKSKNIPWNITIEDVPIPAKCPLLEIPLVMGDKYRWNKPSIDRIDCTKGYVKGNVWIISVMANLMKNFAAKEQLVTFGKNLIKYFDV